MNLVPFECPKCKFKSNAPAPEKPRIENCQDVRLVTVIPPEFGCGNPACEAVYTWIIANVNLQFAAVPRPKAAEESRIVVPNFVGVKP